MILHFSHWMKETVMASIQENLCRYSDSLVGQPLCKREEGSGVMPICDLYRYSQECSPIRSLHVTTNIVELSKYVG